MQTKKVEVLLRTKKTRKTRRIRKKRRTRRRKIDVKKTIAAQRVCLHLFFWGSLCCRRCVACSGQLQMFLPTVGSPRKLRTVEICADSLFGTTIF